MPQEFPAIRLKENGNPVIHDNAPERVKCALDAIHLTMGDRQETYGSFTSNMARMAELVSAYTGTQMNGHDAAIVMALSKISRIQMEGENCHRDNYVDAINYIAAAYECWYMDSLNEAAIAQVDAAMQRAGVLAATKPEVEVRYANGALNKEATEEIRRNAQQHSQMAIER